MPYTPIIGTLGYILSPDRRFVLMIHRNARPDDQAFGKYNGLGGKMERDEDVAACMRREIREEAGIEVTAMQLRGTISWPGFGPNGEDWLGFVFLITGFLGEPVARNREGVLEWTPVQRILDACSPDPQTRDRAALPMWPGDRYFLPLVFDDDPRPFHGVMPYSNGQPVGWRYTRF
ncbi:MAG: 8-oxo-dGTP diphosphatase [Anaerolineae bacterium]|nr:8-oxo-dGTP diphosphatase [Candidatus Roseilinea sp.]MDW8449606.1 8-oxo-dGTP diphosphatase [Anaerolineae bacterium]